MEAETLLNLLDSYWYDLNFFTRPEPAKNIIIPELPFSNNSNQTDPTLPTIHTKWSSNLKQTDFSSSPNSVLHSPKLQTIFSGKQTHDFDGSSKLNSSSSVSLKGKMVTSQSRKKKRLSKSLSDLEFEELKGFMDLGFVFSEDDKDSILGSIIPGLQRLNKNNNINNTNNNNNTINSNIISNDCNNNSDNNNVGISRPYLSEAWEVLEKKKRENGVIKWKVPVSNNQVDMKGYLKSWAHVVASTVK